MIDRTAGARMLLDLQADLWIWRMARGPARRRTAAMRVRGKFRTR